MNEFTTSKGTRLPLLELQGKQYLQVAHRIQWFREEHPLWTIETQIIETTATHSTVKAIVKDETGRVISTGHQTEFKQAFADHLAKAETASIGRSLALSGYGTQFAQDLEMHERLTDSPLSKTSGGASDKPLDTQDRAGGFSVSPKLALKSSLPDTSAPTDYPYSVIVPTGLKKNKRIGELDLKAIQSELGYWRSQESTVGLKTKTLKEYVSALKDAERLALVPSQPPKQWSPPSSEEMNDIPF